MDDLDYHLIEAFRQVYEKCRTDRQEAWRRWARTRQVIFNRPPRAWCLAIRASDLRLRPELFDLSVRYDEDLPFQEAHEIDLAGSVIRDICAPVRIPWPGVSVRKAQWLLGRHYNQLMHWIKLGVLNVRYDKARYHSSRGKPKPIVWSLSPIDPNGWGGAGPHAMWGTIWQYLHEDIDENWSFPLRREPLFQVWRRQELFHGWRWVCPGRWYWLDDPALLRRRVNLSECAIETIDGRKGLHVDCGKPSRWLYLPMPIFNLAKYLDVEPLEVEAPRDAWRELVGGDEMFVHGGTWKPGEMQLDKQPRSFACFRCWNLRGGRMANADDWNTFVAWISGGMLYGSEVKRPEWMEFERVRNQG